MTKKMVHSSSFETCQWSLRKDLDALRYTRFMLKYIYLCAQTYEKKTNKRRINEKKEKRKIIN